MFATSVKETKAVTPTVCSLEDGIVMRRNREEGGAPNHHVCVTLREVVPPARFQRATSRLGGERSMQLSYGSLRAKHTANSSQQAACNNHERGICRLLSAVCFTIDT